MTGEDRVVALFKEGDPAPPGWDPSEAPPPSGFLVASPAATRAAKDRMPRGVPRGGLALAAVAAVVVLAGMVGLLWLGRTAVEPSAPNISPEVISGVFFSDGNWILEIGVDGTMRNGTSPERRPLRSEEVISSGTYTLEGDLLTFTSDGEGICPVGTTATMRVGRPPWSELTITEVDDDNQCWLDFAGAFVVRERFGGTWRPIGEGG